MTELIFAERKAGVLTRPTLPCLVPYHSINLTAGCHYECRYCYAQSFRSYPGHGKVKFYANTLQSLAKQLPHKRKPPEMVYFSTACEPFMPFPEVLDCLYGCMSLLLESGCRLLISTKATIPHRFIELFLAYPGLSHVQMGLTTVDDDIRRLMEPNAASVSERLDTLGELSRAGVSREIRMDPLIPGLTDNPACFAETMRLASEHGIRHGVMSYLFLRRGNMGRLSTRHGEWDFRKMVSTVFTQKIEHYCGNNDIRVPSTEYRRDKYKELQAIGAAFGITLGLCACKNPDMAEACCHPLPPKPQKSCYVFDENTEDAGRGLFSSPGGVRHV